jgi:predicted ester cyclase
VRWTGIGTNDGSFGGREPTGLQVTFTGINSYRISCGIIIEGWSDTDSLALLQHLGFVDDIYPGPSTPAAS